MTFTRFQAQTFYDRFGKKQDAQAFYEDAALDDLVMHAGFEHAEKVFELGCGTGRFALRLLEKYLPAAATYLGMDLSETMIEIATQRMQKFTERAKVMKSDGSIHFPLPDCSVDRVVSTYVFDLLSFAEIEQAISEAHRTLRTDGKLCLVGLTQGITLASRIICQLWTAAFHLRASLVGGCRPLRLDLFFDQSRWSIEYHSVVTQFGVPSEVLIAIPIKTYETN